MLRILFLILLTASCSGIRIPSLKKETRPLPKPVAIYETQDFIDHLSVLGDFFLQSPDTKTIKVKDKDQKYLQSLAMDIINNNEIFFGNLKKVNFIILDTDTPLHFSLPHERIFISKGLITKYIKHESMLAGILSYELVRLAKNIYNKNIIIPVGHISVQRLLSLLRVSIDEKMELHKWAFHLTRRSGFDSEYYLSWLQTQNRNTADFVLLVGDITSMTREEALFKAFLIKEAASDNIVIKKNSSKSFYQLVNDLRET
ncbi:MAG: hypothetical protein ACOVP4_13395 [Bacteriovoracaceae bacterium]